jgi:hypothetical protein
MDDAAGDASIVFALRPSMDHRKMRLDRRPLLIAEPEIVRHESSPPDELESRCDVQFNWVRTLVHLGYGKEFKTRYDTGSGIPDDFMKQASIESCDNALF